MTSELRKTAPLTSESMLRVIKKEYEKSIEFLVLNVLRKEKTKLFKLFISVFNFGKHARGVKKYNMRCIHPARVLLFRKKDRHNWPARALKSGWLAEC